LHALGVTAGFLVPRKQVCKQHAQGLTHTPISDALNQTRHNNRHITTSPPPPQTNNNNLQQNKLNDNGQSNNNKQQQQ